MRPRQGQAAAGPALPAPQQPPAGQPQAARQEPRPQRRPERARLAEPTQAAGQGQRRPQRRPQQRPSVRLPAEPPRAVQHLLQQRLDVPAVSAAPSAECRHQRASPVPHRVAAPQNGFPDVHLVRHPRCGCVEAVGPGSPGIGQSPRKCYVLKLLVGEGCSPSELGRPTTRRRPRRLLPGAPEEAPDSSTATRRGGKCTPGVRWNTHCIRLYRWNRLPGRLE